LIGRQTPEEDRAAARRRIIWPVVTAVASTIVVGAGVLLLPQWVDALVRGYLIVLGGLTIWFWLRVMSLIYPSDQSTRLIQRLLRPRRVHVERLRELEQLETAVMLATSSGYESHVRLRKLFREIATQRLERHNIEIDRDPEKVLAILGTDLSRLIKWTAQPPERNAPGIAAADVAVFVDRLEAL
jgi:hypothetical protein